MREFPRFRSHLAAACFTAALLACGKNDSAGSAASRTIDLAPARTAEPQLADVPVPAPEPARAPTPAQSETPRRSVPESRPVTRPSLDDTPTPTPTPTPAPTPSVAPAPATPAAPAPPPTGTVGAGTTFTVKPSVKVCTNTHQPGDRFTATLASAVTGSNGVEIPAGSAAILRVVDASGTRSAQDSMHLAFDILSIRVGDQTYEVNAHVTQSAPLERVNAQTTGDKARKIGVGAAIGAIAGRVLGGNTKSTVIGGAVGAAAGAAVAAGDTHYEGCLRDDATITLALDKPLVIRLAGAP